MNQAALPDDAPHSPDPSPQGLAERPPARPGRGLAALALLVGLAAAGAAGWALWEQHRQQELQQLQPQLDGLRSQLAEQQQVVQTLRQQLLERAPLNELQAQQQLLGRLQGDQQQLAERLSRVLGASRQDWRLAEAEHLLRLASLRLAAVQDLASAQVLVQAVGEILREQQDADALPAREQVATLLQQLRSVEQPDRSELFVQLAALRDQVATLLPLAPRFVAAADGTPAPAEGDGSSLLLRWREQLSQYFRIQLNADQDIRPLLAGEQLAQLRLTLSLALEQAQWAALNGDAPVYAAALAQARDLLDTYFRQDNPQSAALRSSLATLAARPVSIATPDTGPALAALQAYIQRRQELQDGLPPAPAAAPEAGAQP